MERSNFVLDGRRCVAAAGTRQTSAARPEFPMGASSRAAAALLRRALQDASGFITAKKAGSAAQFGLRNRQRLAGLSPKSPHHGLHDVVTIQKFERRFAGGVM